LSGSVDPSSASTSAWFEYGTTTAYGSTTTPVNVTASTTISAPVPSLLPNTLYHFRIAAQNAGGTTRGTDQTFTTTAPPDTTAPSIPANLTGTATSTSQINLTWTASTDNVGVVGYRINRNGTQVATSGTATFSDTNLAPATAYSYTVSAYDAAGNVSAASAAVSVTTLPLPPVLGTPTASSITSTSATLSGSVDPSSASTSAWFEYGTTTAYGSTTTPVSLTTATTISAPLTSLLPANLYHFRAVAQNAGGITR